MAMRLSCFLFVIGVTLTRVYGLSDEEKKAIVEKMVPILRECGEEFGISHEKIIEWKKDKKSPDDSNACVFACIFKKVGLMDEHGLFSETGAIEKSKKYFSDEEDLKHAAEAAETCTAVNDEEVSDGEKGCDRAKLIFECMHKNADKFGIS